MPFMARFNSTCDKCHKPIIKGQPISWTRTGPTKQTFHVNCDAPDFALTNTEKTDNDNPDLSQVESDNEMPDKSPNPNPDITAQPDSNLMQSFATAMLPYLEGKLASKLDAGQVAKIAHETVEHYLELNPPVKTLNVDVTRPNLTKVTVENAHTIFPKLLYLVSKRHPVLLFDGPLGGPGSGKTTAALQAIKAIGAERFGYLSLNPQTPNSALQGFIDAQGVFRSTVFHDCYANGGVFILDEIDHAGGMILTSMNAAIENGSCAFPSGMVSKHPDFILIATANTPGYGANHLHPERRPIDGATRDRFSYLAVDYDTNMEQSIACSINPNAQFWVTWIQKVRTYCTDKKVKCMVTPRASYRGADYLKDGILSSMDIADALVFRGIDTAVREQILRDCGQPHA